MSPLPRPPRRPRRFDLALMSPPEPGTDKSSPALHRRLRHWCEAGAFGPDWQPLRLAGLAPQPGLDDIACELDGSHALARMSPAAGLAWRLQLLAREGLLAPRRARPQDPWDCGWWREGALATAQAFRPRRPTLLMLREPAAAPLAALLATLRANSAGYTRPLRVLLVSASAADGTIPTLA